jgi:hypothetical protein
VVIDARVARRWKACEGTWFISSLWLYARHVYPTYTRERYQWILMQVLYTNEIYRHQYARQLEAAFAEQ